MRDKSSSRQIVWGIAVSALLHLLLFVLLLNVEPPPAKVEQEAKQAVRLRVLERAQEAKEKAEAEQAKKARQEVADGQHLFPDDGNIIAQQQVEVHVDAAGQGVLQRHHAHRPAAAWLCSGNRTPRPPPRRG